KGDFENDARQRFGQDVFGRASGDLLEIGVVFAFGGRSDLQLLGRDSCFLGEAGYCARGGRFRGTLQALGLVGLAFVECWGSEDQAPAGGVRADYYWFHAVTGQSL